MLPHMRFNTPPPIINPQLTDVPEQLDPEARHVTSYIGIMD